MLSRAACDVIIVTECMVRVITGDALNGDLRVVVLCGSVNGR
jgi:hypothetical protein